MRLQPWDAPGLRSKTDHERTQGPASQAWFFRGFAPYALPRPVGERGRNETDIAELVGGLTQNARTIVNFREAGADSAEFLLERRGVQGALSVPWRGRGPMRAGGVRSWRIDGRALARSRPLMRSAPE